MPKIEEFNDNPWQKCQEHFRNATTGTFGDKTIHLISGLLGLVPALIHKISSVFQEIFSSKVQTQTPPAPPLNGRVSTNPPEEAHLVPPNKTLLQSAQSTKFQQVAQELYNKGEIFYQICQRTDDPSGEFFNLLIKFCETQKISFDELLKDKNALAILNQSNILREVILKYPTFVKERRLKNISECLVQKMSEFFKAAVSSIPKNTPENEIPKHVIIAATLMIRSWCQQQGISLSDLLCSKSCIKILSTDKNFKYVCKCYLEMKGKEASPAMQLARKHAQGEGFVTQLGFNDVADQPEKFKDELRKILIQNHPDAAARNLAAGRPAPDNEKLNMAVELKKMIDDLEYDKYRAELKRLRENRGQ